MLAALGAFTGTQSPVVVRIRPTSVSGLQTRSPRFGARTASLRGDRGTGTGHLPPGHLGHCAVVSPIGPAVPRSPAAGGAGSGRLALRDRTTTSKLRVSNVRLPHRRGSRAQSPPRPGARRPRPRLRSGAERFLRNLPPSSSLLWATRGAQAPYSSRHTDPPHHTQHAPSMVSMEGGLERKGELFRVRVPSRAGARSPPPLTPPRAPMTRSPALFERLPGSPAARGPQGRTGGPRATAARGGRFLPPSRLAKSPVASPAA